MDFPAESNKEYLWCAKLDSKTKSNQWEGREDGAAEQIVLKRACLGAGAKEKERNIIEVTSFNHKQQKVEVCICSLRAGLKEDESLADLTILPPAIFKLVAGSGPVHLVGNHMIMEDMDEGSDDDFSDEDLGNEQMGLDEDEEDSDEEEEDEEEMPQPKKKIAAKVTREENDADEDDGDDEDDLDEDEDDSDDYEDEEEEEEQPAKKRKLMQPQGGVKVKKEVNENSKPHKTPEPAKKKKNTEQTPKKEPPKTPLQQKQNKTPLSAKKSPKTYSSIDELSAAIKKYPGGKPKKEEKFHNWIRSTFRVDNHEWIKRLWKSHKADLGL